MSSSNLSIFVSNADLPIGAATARELLRHSQHMGDQSRIQMVVAGISSKEHPGDLREIGAELVEVSKEPNVDVYGQILRKHSINTVFIVPQESGNPLENIKAWVEASKNQNVQNVVLLSLAGVERGGQQMMGDLENKAKEAEEYLKKSNVQNWSILRQGFAIEKLFYLAPSIRHKKTLYMNVTPNCKWAPLSVFDTAKCAANLLCETTKYKGQTATVTGNKLFSAQELAQMISKVVGTQIQFQEVSKQDMERCLREESELSETQACYIAAFFEMIREGKLDFTTTDMEKIAKKKPESVEEWLRLNRVRFMPVSGRQ
jgi:uncharacterized protein YbjT (DUF2867 family)